MVNMLREDQVKMLSPEMRVQNSVESMYYRTESGDPETDAIVKSATQKAFKEHGVVLNDRPDEQVLRNILVGAYQESAKSLNGGDITSSQEEQITRHFDSFTSERSSFYPTTFDHFERKYDGETVDIAADYDRMVQDNDGLDPLTPASMQEQSKSLEDQRNVWTEYTRTNKMQGAGLSYVNQAPGIVPSKRRTYQQIKQEEQAAADMKGTQYNETYDRYARSRKGTYQKHTAGDGYGFDEHEPIEDDGPEL